MSLAGTGLVKRYRAPSGGTVDVLQGVDVKVSAGQLVVVRGASGSGKSTLLNVLGLLEDADEGDVWYGEACVSRLSRSAQSQARGHSVGFVFQSFMLLPALTALDNVLLAARYVRRSGAVARRRALGLLDEFGVLERRDHYPPQLSGGEQQRVAFCRAVLNEPPVLLADEPTGNLDDVNGRLIADALAAQARRGAAVVVVSHRPEAIPGADTVLTITAGRLEGGAS
jgi:putative ABC transport system ATP-binding protein